MTKILWAIIAVVIIGVIAYYAISSTNPKQGNVAPMPGTAPTTSQPAGTPSAGNKPNSQPQASSQSLNELIMLGSSQKCEFLDAKSNGTFYVASGKARGDFATTTSNKTSMSHMIIDGKTSYIWTDGQKQGMTMTMDTTAQGNVSAQNQNVDINKKLNYHCESWSADSTKFDLPSAVTFVDIKAMMPK